VSAIDGLISGLDTTGVINQLLAAQRAPADRMASRRQDLQSEASAIATIRSLVDNVKVSAQALDSATKWQTVKATTSDTTIATVDVRNTTASGDLSFTVDRLAAAHQLVSAGVAQSDDVEWSNASIVLHVDGEDKTISVAANSATGVRDLNSVVSAINAAKVGVRAQAVQVAPDQFRLQLTAAETGADSEFSVVSGFSGSFDISQQAKDARIVLANGLYDATSPTNTFKDLLPGVDVTVKKTSTDPITVSVTKDVDALANKVQALVTAVNNALTNIKNATKYDPATKTASTLTGDPTARRAATELSRALIGEVTGSTLGAPSLAGISLAKDGTVSFDRAKFLAAYDKDPDAVQELFVSPADGQTSVTQRLVDTANRATATDIGYLRTAEQARKDRATALGKQITAIEDKLDRDALNLRKRFADMEAALGTLKQQGNWLAGQVGSLPTASAGK
jgi:flagellar hook-associated protein 2